MKEDDVCLQFQYTLGNCSDTRSMHAGTDVFSLPNYKLRF